MVRFSEGPRHSYRSCAEDVCFVLIAPRKPRSTGPAISKSLIEDYPPLIFFKCARVLSSIFASNPYLSMYSHTPR